MGLTVHLFLWLLLKLLAAVTNWDFGSFEIFEISFWVGCGAGLGRLAKAEVEELKTEVGWSGGIVVAIFTGLAFFLICWCMSLCGAVINWDFSDLTDWDLYVGFLGISSLAGLGAGLERAGITKFMPLRSPIKIATGHNDDESLFFLDEPTPTSSSATSASEELMTFTGTIDSLLDIYGQPYPFSTDGVAYGYALALPVRLENVGNFYGIVSVEDNTGKAYQVERFNEYGSFWLTEAVPAGVESLTITYQYEQPH